MTKETPKAEAPKKEEKSVEKDDVPAKLAKDKKAPPAPESAPTAAPA